jgi:MFS family permease
MLRSKRRLTHEGEGKTMDDFTFGLLYSVFGAALIGVLLFLLTRGLDRRRYLRPVLYGFFFGAGTSVLFGGGIFAFLMGGVITGYFLTQEVGGWRQQFRAGGLNGTLLISSLILAYTHFFFTRGIQDIVDLSAVTHGWVLVFFYVSTLLRAFMVIVIVGMGAVLGGILRKLLKPAEQKPIGSGVGQVAGTT